VALAFLANAWLQQDDGGPVDIASDGRTLWLGEPYEERWEPFGCQYPGQAE